MQDIEYVSTVRLPALWICVGKMHREEGVISDQWVYVLDAELIVLGNGHCTQICQGNQLFLIREDKLEEVLVDHDTWWYIQLD